MDRGAQEAAGRPAKQLIEDVKASVRRNQHMTPNDLMRRALNQSIVLNPVNPRVTRDRTNSDLR